jgi:hypothetical protein
MDESFYSCKPQNKTINKDFVLVDAAQQVKRDQNMPENFPRQAIACENRPFSIF